MKCEALVKVENNKLFKIEDNTQISTENIVTVCAADLKTATIPAQKGCLVRIFILQKEVEISEGEYNEELLADLRTYLKLLEENSFFAFIDFSRKEDLLDADSAENFISAAVHCARRIKDCASVVGFLVPEVIFKKDIGTLLDANSYTQWFLNDMNKKHSHYVYFALKDFLIQNSLPKKTETNEFVLI